MRLLASTVIVACALALGFQAHAEAASRVLVLDRDGRVHARVDRALPADAGWPVEPRPGDPRLRAAATRANAARAAARARRAVASRKAPGAPRVRATAARGRAAKARRPVRRTVRGELKRLLRAGRIDAATHARHRRAFDRAVRTARRLSGWRSAGIANVVRNLQEMAARGALTVPRLPALFETLRRNVQWWSQGRLPSPGERIEFSDSELVWQYYPGEGIQLQVLGTFGKANGLWMSGDDERLRALLDEMVALAAKRGRALAWEYYFDFGGGRPPWASAMAQATGIQALTRAAARLGEARYAEVATRALDLLTLAPPTGVRVRTAVGSRYLIYSYAPQMAVANAFVQTLVGLYDHAEHTGNGRAWRLFRAGDRQARLDVRASDTGAWSLYQLGGAESDLGYHTLLRDFLRNLCNRTETTDYCETAESFTRYLREPPELRLVTRRVTARKTVAVRFEVSKISRVGLTIRRDGQTLLATSATVGRGRHRWTWRVPARPGTYDVVLAGTDLAGNFNRVTGAVEVIDPRRPPT